MTRRPWLPWEVEFLRQHYADALTVHLAEVLGTSVERVLRKANAMGLKKSVELIAATARERTSRPDHGGRRTRIQPGQEPWNKGKPGSTGHHPNCRATQFQPGKRPHTWVPVGSYRVVPDGTLERKVNDLPGPNNLRWKPVARLVWEEAHGPVPAGHTVVFRPGQKTTDPELVTLDRLECISRAELMARNTVHRYPKEIAQAVQLMGALKRQINQRAKEVQTP